MAMVQMSAIPRFHAARKGAGAAGFAAQPPRADLLNFIEQVGIGIRTSAGR